MSDPAKLIKRLRALARPPKEHPHVIGQRAMDDARAHSDWCVAALMAVTPGTVQEMPPMSEAAARHSARLDRARRGPPPTEEDALQALLKAVPRKAKP